MSEIILFLVEEIYERFFLRVLPEAIHEGVF